MRAFAIRGGRKSCERARFAGERALFVRIVVFGLVLAGPFHVLDRVDQVAVGNHRMVGGLFKLSRPVVFGGAALVFRGMFEQFRGLQMMIDSLLRHVFRITNAMEEMAVLAAAISS